MGCSVLVVQHQTVQVEISHQFETVDVFAELSCYFLLAASDEITEIPHFFVEVVRVVESQDFSHSQNQEVIVQTFFGNTNNFGSVGQIASLGFMKLSPNFDCLYDLTYSSFTLLGLFVVFLAFVTFFNCILLFDFCLIDHSLQLGLFWLHKSFYLAFVLVFFDKFINFLHGFDLLEAAIVVLIAVACLFFIFLLKAVVFSEDIAGLLGDGVCLHKDICLIQSLKLYPTEGIRFNYGVELWDEEFFALDDQSLGGKIYKDFAESDVTKLFELRDVHVEGASEFLLINNDEFAADLISAG